MFQPILMYETNDIQLLFLVRLFLTTITVVWLDLFHFLYPSRYIVKISTVNYLVHVKSTGRFCQILVDFLEYINLNFRIWTCSFGRRIKCIYCSLDAWSKIRQVGYRGITTDGKSNQCPCWSFYALVGLVSLQCFKVR